ncbi:MAG: hypothetical protein HY403_12725 [Elusimicrobia bacterium]|nr:hypothetical protein [Elusimicrobiota bacterium]
MRRGRRRHPAFEAAVFAAALLLAAIIVRELWRRPAVAPPAPEASAEPAAPVAFRPPLPEGLTAPRAELAASEVAPIKLTRIQRPRPKPAAVPAPR